MSAPPDKRPLDLAILRAAKARADRQVGRPLAPFIDEAVTLALPGTSERVIARRIEALDCKGYLECGVTQRSAWISKKGLLRLAELEAMDGRTDGGRR